MPDMTGALAHRDALAFMTTGIVEDAQLHLFCPRLAPLG